MATKVRRLRPELTPEVKRNNRQVHPDRRREILSVRVLPATRMYLESLKCESKGRAIDLLVRAVMDGTISSMIDSGDDVTIVRIAR